MKRSNVLGDWPIHADWSVQIHTLIGCYLRPNHRIPYPTMFSPRGPKQAIESVLRAFKKLTESDVQQDQEESLMSPTTPTSTNHSTRTVKSDEPRSSESEKKFIPQNLGRFSLKFTTEIFGYHCDSDGALSTYGSDDKIVKIGRRRSKMPLTGTICDLDRSLLVNVLKFCDPYEILDAGLISVDFLAASLDEDLWEYITFTYFDKLPPIKSNFDLVWKSTFFIYVNRRRLGNLDAKLTLKGEIWARENGII